MKNLKKLSLSLVSAIIAGSVFACSTNNTMPTTQEELTEASSVDKGFLSGRQFVKTGYTVVKVHYTDQKQLQSLNEMGMDIWTVQNGYAIGQFAQKLLEKVKMNLEMKLEMLSPQEGYSVLNNFDKGYHTYDSTVAELRAVAAKYPNLAKLQDFGDTWEKTKGKADRDLWVMQITGKGDGSKKPGIVFFGNHHARELVTVEIPLKLISHLLDNYGKDPDITNMVDNTEIWIAPMVNPDGHTLAEKGENWRKNKDDNRDVSANAGLGVDLNRNYGHQWNTGGSSDDTNSDTYHGKAPFSEPETQAVRDFMKAHSNLKIMMSYHSFSNLILWPWGWSSSPSPDANKFATIGKKLGATAGYKPEQASQLYIASGITDDYAYGQLKMLSFTTEIGSWSDGFDPPYSKVDKFWKENLPNALYLIKLASENPLNSESAFGPDISSVEKTIDGKIAVNFDKKYLNQVSKVEYFLGKAGAPGQGKAVKVDSTNGFRIEVSGRADNNMIYVRAQNPDGKWGPISVGSLK